MTVTDEKKIVAVEGIVGGPRKDCTDYSFSFTLYDDIIRYTHCGLSEGCISVTTEVSIEGWDDIINWIKDNERKGLYRELKYYYAE